MMVVKQTVFAGKTIGTTIGLVTRLGLVVVLSSSIPLSSLAASSPADKKSELNQIQNSLKQVKTKLKADTSSRQKTQNSLEKIERDIAKRQKRQRLTHEQQARLSQAVEELTIERDQIAAHYEQMQVELASLIRASYRAGKQARLKLVLSQQDPALISRANRYYDYFAAHQNSQLEAMKSTASSLEQANSRLLSEQQTLDNLSLVLEKDQRYLANLKANRETTIAKLDQNIASNTSKVDKLKARQQRLKKLLASIAKRQKLKRAEQARARARAEARAAAKARASEKPARVKKSKKAKTRVKGSGTLPMPLSAPLLIHFGDKRPQSGLRWSGMMLAGQEGALVKSIDAGEVVYADWLQGYGQLIIIDHGNELMSLYGHNSELVKSTGDTVVRGEAISRVGDTAGLSNAALYFEVRHNGRAEDPLKWCKS